MALLETLTLGLGPALTKAVLKLWLPENSVALAATDGIVEILKKRGENFATIDATDRLFRNLVSEIAARLHRTIEIEFSDLPESDHDAAVLSVIDIFQRLDLANEIMRSNLNGAMLEQIARPQAQVVFASLDLRTRALAELILRESAAYAVALAGKLPNFQVAATRELLKRTSELVTDLSRVLDVVGSMRQKSDGDDRDSNFETQYRRVVSQRLDRMQLFGIRLLGAGAREPALSVAYVTLTSSSSPASQAHDVDTALAGLSRVVIRGEAGSGKTTLLHWLAIHAARSDFRGPLAPWNSRIPLLVHLRDYANDSFPPPERFVASVAPNVAALAPDKWAHATLSHGALVLIDGIDEVPAARRSELFGWLQALVEDFRDSSFVISSRPAALDAGPTAVQELMRIGFKQVTLEPFSLADSEALISQWHQAVGRDLVGTDEPNKLDRFERDLVRALRDSRAIQSLASNPLLCSMICALNWDRQQRLPENRMELYGFALDMLLEARDADRKIKAARLAELDRPAKEALLDNVAYWMMRNGVLEAERREAEAQIEMTLQRLSKIPQAAAEVLQELLERSGILREPQIGVVDFIHRTFLEYMAARAAINAGDLGLLVSKARDDSWRETIVFAAGHARGRQRDQLIAKMMETPFFTRRSIEADITAACCLETTSANLDPSLLQGLQDRAMNLFPPVSGETAKILAPAARLNPDLLMHHGGKDEQTVAACIRCAAIVGGERMLRIIESYASHPGQQVWTELLSAWTAFDPDDYQKRVIQKRGWQSLGKVRLEELDSDSMHLLQLLSIRGVYESTDAIERFINRRHVGIGDLTIRLTLHNKIKDFNDAVRTPEDELGSIDPSWFRPSTQRISDSDAARIARLSSLRSLTLGACGSGVLTTISGLPALEELKCYVIYTSEIDALASLKMLRCLTINCFSVENRSDEKKALDLRALEGCTALRELRVEMARSGVRLPAKLELEELHLLYARPEEMSEILFFRDLKKLVLQLSALSEGELDLRSLSRLESFRIRLDSSASITLPNSVKKLQLTGYSSPCILNVEDLVHLSEVTVASAGFDINTFRSLLKLPNVRTLYHPKYLGFDSLMPKEAIERGIEVVSY